MIIQCKPYGYSSSPILALRAAIEQPRQWQGLTDEEIAEAANSVRWSNQYHADFARAIEAKLKEKNT